MNCECAVRAPGTTAIADEPGHVSLVGIERLLLVLVVVVGAASRSNGCSTGRPGGRSGSPKNPA
jgi:hypothetical protein